MKNPQAYAKLLIQHQGKELAKKIAADNLAIVTRSPALTVLFDEAEFHISTEGSLARWEMSKTQSKKVDGLKKGREEKNLSFWKQVNALVNK